MPVCTVYLLNQDYVKNSTLIEQESYIFFGINIKRNMNMKT